MDGPSGSLGTHWNTSRRHRYVYKWHWPMFLVFSWGQWALLLASKSITHLAWPTDPCGVHLGYSAGHRRHPLCLPASHSALCSLARGALSHPRCTCIGTAGVLRPTVQQPFPQHGEGLHIGPLVLCEVLARGKYCEEVRSHCSIHLSDGTGLWEEGQGWGRACWAPKSHHVKLWAPALSGSQQYLPSPKVVLQDAATHSGLPQDLESHNPGSYADVCRAGTEQEPRKLRS